LYAIAAAAMKPPRLQQVEIVFPVVAGIKTDRLPLVISPDAPTDAEKVDVVYVPPVAEDLASSNQSAPQEPASPPPRHLISRHRHDPHDLKFETRKQKATSPKPKKSSADPAPKQVHQVRECRSDGLDPLLRKLNLSPPCN